METRNIIVIGASAGGFEIIKRLMAELPRDFKASIFIVWHMPSDIKGILPLVLNRQQTLYANNAANEEPIMPGRIYVAPPDQHLILGKDHVLVTRGPKENGFRPAIDPLFRSAAYYHGSRVIGIILSGALDDGTAGLWAIKQYGGLAIVQDPVEAEVSSMPASAIREVAVDHIVPVADMAPLLVRLTAEEKLPLNYNDLENNKKNGREIHIAIQDEGLEKNLIPMGDLTLYTCPECHGVLSAIKEGQRVRYRCHTGHAFSADSLLAIVTENIEHSLWNAIRAIEESVMILNHMGDHFAEVNQPHLAAQYFKKANESISRCQLVRQAVLNHERLSPGSIKEEVQHINIEKPA